MFSSTFSASKQNLSQNSKKLAPNQFQNPKSIDPKQKLSYTLNQMNNISSKSYHKKSQ